MHMHLIWVILAVGSIAGTTEAQSRESAQSDSITRERDRISMNRMVLLGIAGGMIGAVGGGHIADKLDNCIETKSDETGVLPDICYAPIAGLFLGESVGVAVGVHLGNQRKGNLWADVGAASGVFTACVAVAVGMAEGMEGAGKAIATIIALATPALQLKGTIAVEQALRGNHTDRSGAVKFGLVPGGFAITTSMTIP